MILLDAMSDRSLERLREDELRGLQERIEKNDAVSWKIGRHLNRARLFVVASPALSMLPGSAEAAAAAAKSAAELASSLFGEAIGSNINS